MASEQHDIVFPEQDMDDDDEDSHDDEEYDDEESEPSPPAASSAVTVAVPSNGVATTVPIPSSAATTIVTTAAYTSDPKHHRAEPIEEKKPPPLDDSRRLFQRLWTDEDEMELLQGFLDYTSQRGSSHHSDTALFYDQIKSKLQLDFNKSQLVEKIRRLKKKYRNVVNRISSGKEFSFKSAHDQATFEVSRKIWGNVTPIAAAEDNNINAIDDDEINLNPTPNPNPNHNFSSPVLKYEVIFGNSTEKKTRKRSRPSPAIKSVEKRELNLNDGAPCSKDGNITTATTPNAANNNFDSGNGNMAGLIEETVKSCLSPLLKELVAGAMRGPFGARGLSPVGLMNLGFGFGGGELVDEKWRKQQILELEVYSKRLELVQDQIKATMEELRSSGGGGRGGAGGGGGV